jgi:hypothetical protein
MVTACRSWERSRNFCSESSWSLSLSTCAPVRGAADQRRAPRGWGGARGCIGGTAHLLLVGRALLGQYRPHALGDVADLGLLVRRVARGACSSSAGGLGPAAAVPLHRRAGAELRAGSPAAPANSALMADIARARAREGDAAASGATSSAAPRSRPGAGASGSGAARCGRSAVAGRARLGGGPKLPGRVAALWCRCRARRLFVAGGEVGVVCSRQ